MKQENEILAHLHECGKSLLALFLLAVGSTVSFAQPANSFAAPGRIEGASPTVRMGFPIMGIVKDVGVKPAARVTKGTILASLICDDRSAAIGAAEADLAHSRAQWAKLKHGSRDEERRVAGAMSHAADVDVQSAKNIATRFEALRVRGGTGGFVPELQVDAASDALKLAQARQSVTMAQATLVNSPARREDVASAEAHLAGALSKVALGKAEVEKCLLRAPTDATILKVTIERGDVVSITPPQIAITLSDLTRLRVRAEVDERFIDRIKIGQSVTITSDFNPKLRMPGKVAAREAQMGRRTVLGIDPADKNDRDVLEVIVDLDKSTHDAANALPVGYRVTVLF
jgi:HlyD family secretion protein